MDENSVNPLKALCIPVTQIRENYYSTTHRAVLEIDGEKKEWDIICIQIPFSPQKEAELMRKFHISREELPEYYHNFKKALKNHFTLTKIIGEQTPANKSVITYKTTSMNKADDGTIEYYAVTEPMDWFIHPQYFNNNGCTMSMLMTLGIRMLQTIKAVNSIGVTLGRIDPESCYLAQETNGKQFLKTGYLFYGTASNSVTPNITYTPDVAPFIYSSVVEGEYQQSVDTDIYMLCCMLWGLLDGRHYSVPADLEYEPGYSTEELTQALMHGMETGADAIKELNTTFRKIHKAITDNQMPDTYIPFEPPPYMSEPLPELRAVAAEPEPEPEEPPESDKKTKWFRKNKTAPKDSDSTPMTDTANEEQPKPDQDNDDSDHPFAIKPRPGFPASPQTPRPKARIGGLIIIGIAIIVLGATVFSSLQPSTHKPDTPPTAQYTPNPDSTRRSAEYGLYAYKGKVILENGKEAKDYILDDEGNMYKLGAAADGSNMLVFDYYETSQFVPMQAFELKLATDDFTPSEKYTWQDNVIDLRSADISYSSAEEASNILPQAIQTQYNIGEDSILIVKENAYVYDEWHNIIGTEEQERVIRLVPGTLPYDPNTSCLNMIADNNTTLRSLQRFSGEWTQEYTITATPQQTTNKKYTVLIEDSEHLQIKTVKGTDMEISASVTLLAGDKPNTLTFIGDMEGDYTVQICSADGMLEQKLQITLQANEISDTPETPTPTVPVVTPEPTPVPTPVPTSVPVPVRTPTPAYEPYTPTQTVPETQPVVQYTPAPIVQATPTPQPREFFLEGENVSTNYTIVVGESIHFAPSESCSISISPMDVLGVDYGSYTFTALKPGTCTITLTCSIGDVASLIGQQIIITVTVVE